MAILNELTRRRLRAFRRRRTAYYSLLVFTVMFILGMGASLVANDVPYLMKYKGEYHFPLVRELAPFSKGIRPSELGIHDTLALDYRELRDEMGAGEWMVLPPIPWGPYTINKDVPHYPAPPSSTNFLGTDDRGRDVSSRLVHGFKTSMIFALGVWVLEYILGIVLGALQGYFGGKIDFLGQRLIEIYSAIPFFFLLLILISIFNPNVWMLVLLYSIFGWTAISAYIRAEFLRLRKFEFVEASRALGQRTPNILFKQIFPNALTPVITFSPFAIAGGVVGLAGLDYLGFGLQPPTASWGELLSQAHRLFDVAPWLAFATMFMLFFTVSLLNLVGEGVRYAFDPKKY